MIHRDSLKKAKENPAPDFKPKKAKLDKPLDKPSTSDTSVQWVPLPKKESEASAGDSQRKKKSKPKHKRKPRPVPVGEGGVAPVVRIPTGKEQASTNWKLLLTKKATEIAGKKKEIAKTPKPTFLRRDVKKHKRLLMEEKKPEGEASSAGGGSLDANANPVSRSDTAKDSTLVKSTEKLSLTQSDTTKSKHGKPDISFPKLTGLNSLNYFDYTHYGHLKTPVGPEHEFLTRPTPAVAIDCEMVGVGPLKEDALARVSIVNEFGYCLYDKFVKPKLEVTDYRTVFSGVREEDLKNAEDFATVLQNVAELMKGRVLVGHSLGGDFDVLLLKHPKAKIRDTAMYYRRKFKRMKTPALKTLVKDHLKVEIQKGEHNSITDAQAAMKLYLIMRDEWEASYSQKYNTRLNRYWMTREYRKAFQAIGFVIQIKKK